MKFFLKIFLLMAFTCYASEVAVFCVTFSKDCNKYYLHLVRDFDIQLDSNLVYPDSVCCAYKNCSIEWKSSISLQSPRKIPSVINGDWFRSPRGILSSFHVCSHCDSCEERRQVPLLEMGIDPLFQHSQLYENACSDLKEYYGTEFSGKWKAQLNVANVAFEKNFKAKIIGECEKPLLLAEYCIDDDFVLRKTKTLSYLPQKHLLDSFEIEIKGKYEYEKTMSLDLFGFGGHSIVTYGEKNICEKKHVLWGGIRLPIPNKIDIMQLVDDSISIDFFYAKEFVEKWDIKYIFNKKVITDFDEYKIRITGKCETSQVIEDETPLDYSQYWEKELYSQDSCQIYWKK